MNKWIYIFIMFTVTYMLTVVAAPAAADDMDVLGQFLEQNFPTQNDPMEAFVLSHA